MNTREQYPPRLWVLPAGRPNIFTKKLTVAKPDAVPHRVNVELMDPPPDDKAHNPAQAKYNRSSKDFGGMFPTPSVQ